MGSSNSAVIDDDRGPEILAVSWTFTALATIFVALKVFTRTRILNDFGWDDFFVILSLLLIITCTSIFTYDVHIGMGRHAQLLEPAQLVRTVKINFIGNPFGIMAYSLPNISVAILLDRILAPVYSRKWLLYGLAVSQTVIAGISCIVLFTQCTPSEHLWNPLVPAQCLSPSVITGYSYFVGSFSAFTDIVLAIVPIAAFWNLQMKLKTKIGLCILMSLTLVAAICAIVKTTKLYQLADLEDFTYGTVDLVIWVIIEANVIIMAACVPTLRPFVYSLGSRNRAVPHESSIFRIRSFFTSNSLHNFFQSSRKSTSIASRGDSQGSKHGTDISLSSAKHITATTQIETKWESV